MERRDFVKKSGAMVLTGVLASGLYTAESVAIETSLSLESKTDEISNDDGELNSLELQIGDFRISYKNIAVDDALEFSINLTAEVIGENINNEATSLANVTIERQTETDEIRVLSQTGVKDEYALLSRFDDFSPKVPNGESYDFIVRLRATISTDGIPNYQPVDDNVTEFDSVDLTLTNPN